ncbi:hypothetical protein COU54_01345 [Candidatus Pacearchaeota archaeon CG10_big_fil_rev_8_21_14_0_10_31_24]|nr:MAG: hypothetical protein COU54_01345 [Candidatus Pacearchaeota archaeon CG10_big_fil_rev_8_21_14_0_10_31_24]
MDLDTRLKELHRIIVKVLVHGYSYADIEEKIDKFTAEELQTHFIVYGRPATIFEATCEYRSTAHLAIHMLHKFQDIDPNIYVRNFSPLLNATYACDAHAKELILHGAKVNDISKCLVTRTTPLIIAVTKRKFDLVKLLVEYGADIHLKPIDCSSAYEYSLPFSEIRQYFDENCFGIYTKSAYKNK